MEMLKKFFSTHYENAIRLKERFKCTEPKIWSSLIVSNELAVQYGHLINTTYQDEFFNENNRNIVNVGDEVADVLLQLCYLGYLEEVDFTKIDGYEIKDIDVKYGVILLGQLIEALMEKEGYRYRKERVGFETIQHFIEDRIIRLLLVVYKFSCLNNLDIVNDFDLMLKDANGFLDRYVQ